MNIEKLTKDVKKMIDLADWKYATTNGINFNYDDCDKACNYLGKCRFSLVNIRERLDESMEDIIANIDKDVITPITDIAVNMISDTLAQNRINYLPVKMGDFSGVAFRIQLCLV